MLVPVAQPASTSEPQAPDKIWMPGLVKFTPNELNVMVGLVT